MTLNHLMKISLKANLSVRSLIYSRMTPILVKYHKNSKSISNKNQQLLSTKFLNTKITLQLPLKRLSNQKRI